MGAANYVSDMTNVTTSLIRTLMHNNAASVCWHTHAHAYKHSKNRKTFKTCDDSSVVLPTSKTK